MDADDVTTLNNERAAKVKQLYRDLDKLGARYEAARLKAKTIRDQAEPIIVALSKLGEEQGVIAKRFRVVRETIRRIQIANGVDTGDPRAKPGSRAGRPAKAMTRATRSSEKAA